MFFAEKIPNPKFSTGWIVDVRYMGLEIIGMAVDEESAKNAIETFVFGLCAVHGLAEPPCLKDDNWDKLLVADDSNLKPQ